MSESEREERERERERARKIDRLFFTTLVNITDIWVMSNILSSEEY